MAQAPWTPLDATVDDGVTLSDKLNQSMPAIYSNHAGNAQPLMPLQGQFWVDTGALPVLTIKQYDGAVWRDLWSVNVTDGTLGGPLAGGAGGGASVTISATPPVNPKVGDLWFDSVRLNTFVYYEDADSTQWVQIVPTSAGMSQDVADTRYVNLTGDVMGGDLTIKGPGPSLILNSTDSIPGAVELQKADAPLYRIHADSNNDLIITRNINGGASGDVVFRVLSSNGQTRLGGSGGGWLRCADTTNVLGFRWASNRLYYNLDGVVDRAVPHATNATAFSYAPGAGGPVGVALNGYDFSGNLYGILVDAASDARIKDNIRDTEVDAVLIVKSIPVRTYEVKAEVVAWNKSIGLSEEERNLAMINAKPVSVPIGFVTQEIQPFVPEAVNTPPPGHQNPKGCPLPDDMQTYSASMLVPYLWRAVQQLADRVAELENRTR